MPEWLVRLQGDQSDLEDLSRHLSSSDPNVTEKDGHYHLRSADFDPMTDHGAVRERAAELLECINSAVKYKDPSFQDVSFDFVTRINEDGKKMHFMTVVATIGLRARASATPLTADGAVAVVEPPQHPSEIEALVALANRDQEVAEALRFFRKGDVNNLYKAWEIVRDAAGGERKLVEKGWTTRKAQSRFTGTAQDRAVLGDEARHASKKYKAPKDPMNPEEMRSFVRSLIEAWVRSKKP